MYGWPFFCFWPACASAAICMAVSSKESVILRLWKGDLAVGQNGHASLPQPLDNLVDRRFGGLGA